MQAATLRLFDLLAFVREMDQRERETFAAIGRRAFLASLGPELLVEEAEDVLRRAA